MNTRTTEREVKILRTCLDFDPTRRKAIHPDAPLLRSFRRMAKHGLMKASRSFLLRDGVVSSVETFRVTAMGKRAADGIPA